MVGYVIVGSLAAFGLLCAVWLIRGMLLPRCRGTVLIFGENGPEILQRCLWLREMHLLDCELVAWETDFGQKEFFRTENTEIWNAADLIRRLGLGAKEHGAGSGDPPGCHQCGGISEL